MNSYIYTTKPKFVQICRDIDTFDLHSSWWDPSEIIHSAPPSASFLFHGPPGVGKYAHAIHLLREYSPSKFTSKKNTSFYIDMDVPNVSHCSNNPPQQFVFTVSDIHIEIDLEQLGPDPLTVWDTIFRQAYPLFPFFICTHIDKAPPDILNRLYTYMLPVWPPSATPSPRFIFITEQSICIPQSLLQMNIHHISFPRPTISQYLKCIESLSPPPPFPHETQISKRDFLPEHLPEPFDITSIHELKYQLYSECTHAHSHAHVEDPFGLLCDKLLECIQNIYLIDTTNDFSIEDIRSILNEWAMHQICYEEGLWYVLGKCIVMNLVDESQIYTLIHKWGTSGTYFQTLHTGNESDSSSILYNYKRAEYMCAELMSSILYTRGCIKTLKQDVLSSLP